MIRRLLFLVSLAVGITWIMRTFLFDTISVASGSMEPTLQIGDELMAAKYAYGYSRYSLPFGLGSASPDR